MMHLDCDVLIVGSGAAGGVLAATLSEMTSCRVILAEKGAHYTRSFFNQREVDMNVLYADEGARSTSDGSIPVRGGECVGGGTTVNVALCFDPVADVWESWKRTAGLTGFTLDPQRDDYGIPGLSLARCVAEVRERLNIHRAADADVNDNNRIFEAGCRRLGISTRRFELNMRGCIGSGYCGQGCSYDAKQGTMITYIADAVAGGVRLVHHFEVERVDFDRRHGALHAVGVRGRVLPTRSGSQPNGLPAGPLRITAKLVIVCAGAVESPALLQRSELPDPHDQLGRGLVLHPSLPLIGLTDRELVNYRGIPGTVYSDHFRTTHGFYFEVLFGHPVYGSVVMPGFGAEHFDMMLNYRRLMGFGVMLIDTVDRGNRVQWSPRRGRPVIRYRLSESDKTRLRFAAAKGVEIGFAAGATEVLIASDEPIGPLSSPRFGSAADAIHCSQLRFLPHATTITSAHAQATVKMGEDPTTSCLNSRGESHHARNLIVCDSSSFPGSCGANPMVSILSMARYQGRRIAAERARYAL